MVWSCRGALSMRQHHAAVKKSRNRLQVPALQSGRLRSETSGPTRCEPSRSKAPKLVWSGKAPNNVPENSGAVP